MAGQACVGGSATLTEGSDEMKYSLFTSVQSTEQNHDQQQLLLYIYGCDSESAAKQNEKETLGLVKVRSDGFSWSYPRGDIVTAVVSIGDFSSTQEQKTQKLTSTKLQDKWIFRLPSSNATQYLGDMKILDQDRLLVKITDTKFPIWPKKTKEGAEHDEGSTSQGGCNRQPQTCTV